jgi:predicted TIM-barrel fold metal-dependent hydrolase
VVSTAAVIDDVLRDIKVVDADTHVVEPYDLWTSRLSAAKWGDKVPHVVWNEQMQREVWMTGDTILRPATSAAWAGYDKPTPLSPTRWTDVKTATWDPQDRLALMTEYGIHSAVLYPNVPGFGAGKFTDVAGADGALALEMIQAYNDFLIDYCSNDPDRFIPVMAVPFWDVEVSLAEIKRAAERGHRGIIFSQQPDLFGCPRLGDHHWDPIWAACQDMELPVNFHVGSGDLTLQIIPPEAGRHANYAVACALTNLANGLSLASMIGSGVCHRYPNLQIVSVESGVGWIPYTLQAFDWMWKESAVAKEHPEYDLLPSEYFRRQIYACFVFEYGPTLQAAIDYVGDEHVLFETDFPHPSSMSPGPCSHAVPAKDFIRENLSDLPETTLRRILHDNAAKLYKLD